MSLSWDKDRITGSLHWCGQGTVSEKEGKIRNQSSDTLRLHPSTLLMLLVPPLLSTACDPAVSCLVTNHNTSRTEPLSLELFNFRKWQVCFYFECHTILLHPIVRHLSFLLPQNRKVKHCTVPSFVGSFFHELMHWCGNL